MATGVTDITDYLVTQSWQIALLVLVVAAVNLALRNRSAHVRYLLWLIVLAKCLVPPFYAVPLAILPQQERSESVTMTPPVHLSPPEFEAIGAMMTEPAELSPIASQPPAAPAVERGWRSINVHEGLAIGWLVGACVFLMFNLLRALRANLWLWKRRQALPAELRTNIENLFSAHGVRNFPHVWLVEGFNQPFVWGLLRGSIYVPVDFLNINRPEHQESVLGHELSHVFRFDAAVNILQVVAQAIFWFHPFVWWANRKMRAEREKCCDEMAIARLNTSPRNYSTAILETLAAKREATRPVPSLAVAGPVKNIEERIKTMLRPGKKFYKHPTLVTITAALLLALLAVPTSLVLTARAQTEPDAAQRPEPARSIYYAASVGDIEQVKLHISRGTDVNEKTSTGDTALHYAARNGHEDVAKLLIASGARVNEKTTDGDTPLHYAAQYGRKNVAELLILQGADVDAKNKHGDWPTHLALKGNLETRKKEVLELLVAKGPTLSCIQMAAHQGDLTQITRFLEQDIDVDSKDSEGRTALHYAALQGQRNVVQFLLSKGANVNAKDGGFGFVPLHHASGNGHKDVVKMLIAKGADVNAKDKYGWTPLDCTVYDPHNSVEVAKLLIESGANVNSRYDWGETPLIWAAQIGNKDVADLLIAKGAEIDARDHDGCTPLYHAALTGHRNVVELLIAKGADVNARDARGRGPLWQATRIGHDEITELLREHGAKE